MEGNSNPDVDDLLIVNVTATLVDDVNCDDDAELSFELYSNFNDLTDDSQYQSIFVQRTGHEKVLLSFNVYTLNDTSNITFSSGYDFVLF